jgi:hypothetical protein|tara:strand:- start:176 stop:493 length:318 start_codon:yes stop_codon:yes gene_type:complete
MYIIDTFNKITFDGDHETNFGRVAHLNGWQKIFKFPNGFGASIVNHDMSYGFELALLYDGNLVYHPKITMDVIGGLTPCRARNVLKKIAKLSQNDLTEFRNPLEC